MRVDKFTAFNFSIHANTLSYEPLFIYYYIQPLLNVKPFSLFF
ncbi:hypothetical protein ANACOL_01341 [Anaerotruncus colihominis DSM 17241]|uniref:Uncharacterized protein n=1 Tax=Anaerotruncus colihominis DSM 17241 TaxID=445972 RepID=B0P995_9FIRM|nr:hypothetical protein ANACOL_01341 [Anaerotruncus colihominis DSM 17241]